MAPTAMRRVITGHDDQGKAIIHSDDLLQPHNPSRGDGGAPNGKEVGFVTVHRTEGIPAKIQGSVVELHPKQIPLCTSSDVTCRIVDFPPGAAADGDNRMMHRTISLDYGVVLSGQITLELDDGVTTVVNAGDVVVQRGTIHAWRNFSTEHCRMMFVLVPSEKVKVNNTGEILQETSLEELMATQK